MSESSVNMKFTAQTADAQKRIAELEKEISRLNKETKDSSSESTSAASGVGSFGSSAAAAVAGIAAAAAAIKTLVSAAKACVDAYRTQEQADTRLQAVLKATDNQIGATVTELKSYASAVQSISRFGDETVVEAEKVLVATQALDKDGLQRAIMASADLAEAMGTDIVSAASTMAYALQDPEQGLARLRRQGIAFTDEEIAQVKALQDANDLYGAQAIVLEKIESKYKGVAKAVGDTPTGTLDKIKNVWGDIKENFGEGIVRSLAPAFDWLLKQLNKINEWVKDKNDQKEFSSLLSSGSYEQLGQKFSGEYLRTQEQEILADYVAQVAVIRNGAFGEFVRTSTPYGLEELLKKSENEIRDILNSALTSKYGPGNYDYVVREYLDLIENLYKPRLDALQTIEKAISYSDQQQLTVIDTLSEYVAGESASSGSDALSGDPAWKTFMDKYGRDSISYKASEYQKIIDQAEELRSQMYQPIVPGASMVVGNTDLMHEWGMDIEEFSETYRQLGEIIESTKKKKDDLFAEPEEKKEPGWLPVDYLAEYNDAVTKIKSQLELLDKQIESTTDPATLEYLTEVRDSFKDQYDELTGLTPAVDELNEYIKEHASLSATAQAAMLDAQIAEAEMWKQSESAGEAEIRILDEIIEKWKEQRDEIGKTGKTWQDNVKEFLGTWSPAISKFQDLTSAVVGFQQQLWENQADELEAALERDKQTGDMSEEEEKERLARIDDLRRKSFEAQKANSISNALINGALAVTQCLTEGIPGYVMAGIVAATTAVQVAQIASQQYTPMAKGGIVTQATPIIAGEAGPEAIIPLSGGRAQQYLGNAGSVVINITIEGNADEEVVFHAIERAQRTGYLPNWSYA